MKNYLKKESNSAKQFLRTTVATIVFLVIAATNTTQAQEWSTGLDINSSYVWRGTKFGSGPAIQPSVTFTAGGLTVGAWGSINSSKDEATEMDAFISYDFDFGASIGVTNYYYPGTKFFDFSENSGSHAFELNAGYKLGDLSLSGNIFLNNAYAVGGVVAGDIYFEAKYGFKNVDLFVGGGNGWHTPDQEFGIVNVGISTSKELKITDSFSIPLNGSVILNPTTEQFFIVVGISL